MCQKCEDSKKEQSAILDLNYHEVECLYWGFCITYNLAVALSTNNTDLILQILEEGFQNFTKLDLSANMVELCTKITTQVNAQPGEFKLKISSLSVAEVIKAGSLNNAVNTQKLRKFN